ncbi:hypothetical protein RND71_042069 [Anisodus tanguticus]|uniref:Uncharacterized protein n=1 Tax=Anisodus tanguticus TaxID=243964 RepID=A0AAE1UNT1_9SOLA|nr:hypothetical protein RND71_042069 [Anisodus tanguticus]
MSQSNMYQGNNIEEEEIDEEDMDDEEIDEEFYEAIYNSMMAIYAIMHVLNQFLNMMRGEYIERPLTRRRITSIGYDYIHQALNNDPTIFRQASNSIASDFMAKPRPIVPAKIRESTRFYPYFKITIAHHRLSWLVSIIKTKIQPETNRIRQSNQFSSSSYIN